MTRLQRKKINGKKQQFYDGNYLYLFVSATGKRASTSRAISFTLSPLLNLLSVNIDQAIKAPMPDNKEGYPSENAVNSVLHKLGYKGKQVAHGFRTTASSQLNASGLFDSDAIEKQLAHNDKSQMRAIYNRADYLKERRKMLQYWSDRIDELRNGA